MFSIQNKAHSLANVILKFKLFVTRFKLKILLKFAQKYG